MSITPLFIEVTKDHGTLGETKTTKAVIDISEKSINADPNGGSYITSTTGGNNRIISVSESPEELHERIRNELRLIYQGGPK